MTAGSEPAWLTRWISEARKWKVPPARKTPLRVGPVDRQTLLADGPADDGDGAGGDVVVVEAGVVLVHPADQPGGQVLVAEQLLVYPLGGVVLDESNPQLGPVGELADERLQLRTRQVAPARARERGDLPGVERRRCVRWRRGGR